MPGDASAGFKRSLAGPIPRGWDVRPLGALFSVQLGKMLGPRARRAAGAPRAPYLRNVNVQWGELRLHDLREMEFDAAERDGFVDICAVDDIEEDHAVTVCLAGDRVAVFRYGGLVSAVSNACQHQNGPLGEGRVLDGCITCPWHGFQYRMEDGQSPPPFTEKVATYATRIMNGTVYVNPKPNPPGTPQAPSEIGASS